MGTKTFSMFVYGGADQFFVAEGTEVEVVGEVLAERLDEGLVVLGGVEFFGAEKLFVTELPSALQHLHVEEFLILGWDVLEERENTVSVDARSRRC